MKLTTAERRKRAKLAAETLRNSVDTAPNMLMVFGKCLAAKFMAAPSKSQMPGKHYWADNCKEPHPAGTKLVRRFIRQSGKESTYNRRLYAYLTGHQYR
jgi:hypothetical protein